MDMDFIPSPSLVVLTKTRVRDLFEFYFRDDQVRTVYKQLRQTQQEALKKLQQQQLPENASALVQLQDSIVATTDEAVDGWVPISMIAAYKRIKIVTESPSLILEALQESSVLQVNEQGTHVRRTTQYSGTDKDEGKDAKMAHAKGFLKVTPLGSISEFFAQFGVVRNVRWIRSPNDPLFRGTVFIEFDTSDAVSRLLSHSEYKFQDRRIFVSPRSRAEVPTTKKKQQIMASSGKLHFKDSEEDEDRNYAEDDQGRKFLCDRIIHFTGVDPNTPQANLKKAFEKQGVGVAYVDYRRDETYGYVRLKKSVASKTVNSFNALGGLTIGRDDVSLRALKGKEEIAYWTIAHDVATSKPYVAFERSSGSRNRNKNKPAAAKLPSQNMGEDGAHAGGSDTMGYDDELKTGSKRKLIANDFGDDSVDSQQGLRVLSNGGVKSSKTSRKKRKKENQMFRMFGRLKVVDEDDSRSDPISEALGQSVSP
ncbi:hypothetical protein BC937DRAFT_92635 [Endogone sp. FLAS-F59071]|nr:hypothetical protein BC937DRAFT_92635 [Endogone sp. FLAS-F59071]|eukprot:RUS15300.1 hypothetical protein BC937DRAFT_92635 [Endogone sp. FLAS-F59071]